MSATSAKTSAAANDVCQPRSSRDRRSQQPGSQIASRGLHGRSKPDEQARRNRHEERQRRDPEIDPNFSRPWQIGWPDADEHADQRSGRRADRRLRRRRRAARLRRALCATIRAREAPRAARTAISRRRAAPRTTKRLAMFAHATSRTSRTAASSIRSIGADRPLTSSCSDTTRTAVSARCVSGCSSRRRSADRGEVVGSLRCRNAGLQAPDHSEESLSAVGAARIRRRRIGRDDVDVADERHEIGAQDADDREAVAVQDDRRTHRVGGSAEQPLPQAVADQRDGAVLVIRLDRAPKLDLRTGDVEIVRRHAHPGEPLGVAAAGEVRAPSEERGNRRRACGWTA